MRTTPPWPLRARQQGAALLIILIILILVTLMGLTTMRTSRLQEKMAGGAADKALAFQASELALRDGELHILKKLTSGARFMAGCDAGLCLPNDDGSMLSDSIDWDTKAAAYGVATGAGALGGVRRQPRYIIELLADMAPPLGNSVKASATGTPYRITGIGYGKQESTRVVLQSTYFKP